MTNVQCSAIILQYVLMASVVNADTLRAIPASGEPFQAELAAVDAQWQITFRVANEPRMMPAADLVTWGKCPEQGRAAGLVLADGSFVAAQIVAADKDALTADSDAMGTVKLPLESLSGIVLRRLSSHADDDKLLDRLAQTISPRPFSEGPGAKAGSGKEAGQGGHAAS